MLQFSKSVKKVSAIGLQIVMLTYLDPSAPFKWLGNIKGHQYAASVEWNSSVAPPF